MRLLLILTILFSLNAAGQTVVQRLNDGHFLPLNTNPNANLKFHGDTLYWDTTCPHIYVAVLPDTVVWDKTVKSPYTSTTAEGHIYIIDPAPVTQKIVCILCHKVTEQKIKIINEPKN